MCVNCVDLLPSFYKPDIALTASLLYLQFLSLHVIPNQALDTNSLTDGLSLPTLLMGQNLTVSRTAEGIRLGSPGRTGAKVIDADHEVYGGFVHIIDAILVPSIVAPNGESLKRYDVIKLGE